MELTTMTWDDHQNWEKAWHEANNNCSNSFNEEYKQFDYASKMGLNSYLKEQYGIKWFDFGKQTVLDVGGGPYSLLLKSKAKKMAVLDPCEYPNWTKVRYAECNIDFIQKKAEEMDFEEPWDIILSYNVLQHTENPEEICRRMRKHSKLIYFFDWLEIGVAPGHPQNLHEEDLNKWLGGEGKVEKATRGFSYAGIFVGDHYKVSN